MKINILTLIILFMGINVNANNNTSEVTAQIKAMGVGFNNFYKTYQQNQVNGVFSTVGADNSCDFTSIQDAIDNNADEVRIATNMVYNEKMTLTDRDIIIRGGFTTCTDANNNNQSINRSIIDHTGLNLGAIIAISGSNQRSTIVLENLRLTGAASGGIETVVADAEILLNNMRIDNNHLTSGAVGGGIGVFGGDTDFILIDSIISENSAEFGGGILCSGANISFSISGESGVSQNMATGIVLNSDSGKGGGLFVTNGCEIIMYSGTQNTNAQTLIGISGNQAIADGGGIYISQGGNVLLSGHKSTPNGGIDFFGDDSKPVNLNNNISDLNDLGYGGGGAFVVGTDSFLIINGGLIKDNVSSNGGGFFTQNDATLFVTRLEKECWDSDRCNFIQGNIAKNNGNGGAVFNDSGRILITNTYFEDNQAGLGTAIYVKGSFAQGDNRIDVDIFNHNSSPANSLNDKHVIHLESSRMEISHSTFADNDVEEAVVGVDMFSDLRIVTSIIHESAGLAVSGAGANSTVSGCMMVHNITNIAVGRVDDPEFVDRDNRDYHLNPSISPAIDMCSDFAVSAFRDIDFNQRHWDYPNIDNTFGSPMSYSDAGADEVYDIIFKNDFE